MLVEGKPLDYKIFVWNVVHHGTADKFVILGVATKARCIKIFAFSVENEVVPYLAISFIVLWELP